MVFRTLDVHKQKNKIGPSSYTKLKNQLKIGYRFECKTWKKKLLEENLKDNLFDIDLGNIIYSPKTETTNGKTNKWDNIKLKYFCSSKGTINKIKRQPMNERKCLQIM